MKKQIVVGLIVSMTLGACGDSSSGVGDLGTQIDSMGRAAVNTALNNTFASDAERGGAEDNYNSRPNRDRGSFAETMAAQLAVYDALAGSCGDNPLTNRASADPADGLATGAGRYDFLAGVLADDRLYVNSSSGGAVAGQCNVYLASELGVIGVTGFEADCGGRTPQHDVIQTTYSAVAVGGVTGVDDGISSDNVTHSATQFPFLAAPVS